MKEGLRTNHAVRAMVDGSGRARSVLQRVVASAIEMRG